MLLLLRDTVRHTLVHTLPGRYYCYKDRSLSHRHTDMSQQVRKSLYDSRLNTTNFCRPFHLGLKHQLKYGVTVLIDLIILSKLILF